MVIFHRVRHLLGWHNDVVQTVLMRADTVPCMQRAGRVRRFEQMTGQHFFQLFAVAFITGEPESTVKAMLCADASHRMPGDVLAGRALSSAQFSPCFITMYGLLLKLQEQFKGSWSPCWAVVVGSLHHCPGCSM